MQIRTEIAWHLFLKLKNIKLPEYSFSDSRFPPHILSDINVPFAGL
jgi:hypothetical protein